jgi:antitoxin component YwqK of YwqJK toxin-antitoxin module
MMIQGFGGGEAPDLSRKRSWRDKRQRQGNLWFPWSFSFSDTSATMFCQVGSSTPLAQRRQTMHKSAPFLLALGSFILLTACSPLPKGVVGLPTKVSKAGIMQECTFYNNGKEVAKTFYNDSGALIKTEGKIPDGPVKQMLSEKVVGMELNYLNNLKDGPYKVLNAKGMVLAEGGFKADKLDGAIKTYNAKGVAVTERTYQAGVLNGPSRWFYENGSLKIEKNYALGKEDGQFVWKDEKGTITATETYKNGKKIK